ncbi:MAG TPA: DsbA family protein [Methylovirgula sp.]
MFSQGFPFSRRRLCQLALGAGLALSGAAVLIGSHAPARADDTQATVSVADLMAKQALPDIAQGQANAPITIVEYASMTCGHCARFHSETYPLLKKNYIDTGKVRFILREFPLDPLAAAGFMLARCAGDDKRYLMIDLLFDKQKDWAFADKPLEALSALVKQTGMSEETFNACVNNQALYDQVNQVRDYAAKKFNIDATPTFFVNGKKITGEIAPNALDPLLQPLLKKS